jgi:hypothetical protein
MLKRPCGYSLIAFAVAIYCFSASAFGAGPRGAKAIFDSGEGATVQMSANRAPAPSDSESVSQQRYVGISYELLLLTDNGQMRKVTSNRAFSSGERIIMRVMTNRSGNLKIFNIGPTGNTNLLFDGLVDAYTMTQVPRGSNFRFVGGPGAETLLIMLSDAQVPGIPNPQVTVGTPPSVPGQETRPPQRNEPSQVAGIAKIKPTGTSPSTPSGTSSGSLLPPPSSDGGSLPPPPPSAPAIVSNIESAKGIKGGKDIVMEDQMQSSFAVVSPRNRWQPVKSGTKDIVVESNNGTNYGVVPVSAVSDGGILSLTVKLRHR